MIYFPISEILLYKECFGEEKCWGNKQTRKMQEFGNK